jgi:ABC-type transport system involved in multi-copper enzyme maturation permease subunit
VNGGRLKAIIRKELREFRRNKFIVGTMVFLPLFFLILPTAQVLALNDTTTPAAVKATVGSATLLFFLVPLILPTVIAAQAIIGERDQGALEPVLTTPVMREELLLGKALAAIVPTVLIAYALTAAFGLAIRARGVPRVVHLFWQPSELVATMLFAPLLAAFSIWIGLAISVRSNDVRVAQQLSSLATLPMVGLLALFAFRVIEPSVEVALAGVAVLIAIDAAAWRLVSRMFDRERLLTRYGRP